MIAAHRKLIAGLATGLVTAVLWGSWAVISRVGLTDGLDFHDVTALRFGVAGLVLLPVLVRRGIGRKAIAGVPWHVALILWAGAGVPYSLLVFAGLGIAPASHQAVIGPSVVLLLTAVLSWIVLGERLGRIQLVGMAIILAGVAALGAQALFDAAGRIGGGHVLFVIAGASWAVFTVVARAWRVDALVATAIVSVLSLAYLPLYFALFGLRLLAAPPSAVLLQAVFQGFLTGVVALILFMRAVTLLGAGRAALFVAVVPAMGALFAAPVLGESLTPPTLVGAALVSLGMVLAVGRGVLWPGRAAATAGQSAGIVPGSQPPAALRLLTEARRIRAAARICARSQGVAVAALRSSG
jgi:drug/metabolite transporter (DMT)-like permease